MNPEIVMLLVSIAIIILMDKPPLALPYELITNEFMKIRLEKERQCVVLD